MHVKIDSILFHIINIDSILILIYRDCSLHGLQGYSRLLLREIGHDVLRTILLVLPTLLLYSYCENCFNLDPQSNYSLYQVQFFSLIL